MYRPRANIKIISEGNTSILNLGHLQNEKTARQKGGQFVLILHAGGKKVKMGNRTVFFQNKPIFFTFIFRLFSSNRGETVVY